MRRPSSSRASKPATRSLTNITRGVLEGELDRLRRSWSAPGDAADHDGLIAAVLGPKALEKLDLFDRVQLAFVVRVCRESATLSEAGRKLYAATRGNRKVQNDADRLRKYLARFGLDWQTCQG